MKTDYCLIKATTELPHNEENPLVNSSWGTLIGYKKECILVHYLGLAPVFKRLRESKSDTKGRVTLLTTEKTFPYWYKKRFV